MANTDKNYGLKQAMSLFIRYKKPELIKGQPVYNEYRPLYVSLRLNDCKTGQDRNYFQQFAIFLTGSH